MVLKNKIDPVITCYVTHNIRYKRHKKNHPKNSNCDSIIKKSESKSQKSSNENLLNQHNWGNMGREAQGFLFSEPFKIPNNHHLL